MDKGHEGNVKQNVFGRFELNSLCTLKDDAKSVLSYKLVHISVLVFYYEKIYSLPTTTLPPKNVHTILFLHLMPALFVSVMLWLVVRAIKRPGRVVTQI